MNRPSYSLEDLTWTEVARILAREAAVHLDEDRRVEVEALALAPAEIADRIRPRGDRLRQHPRRARRPAGDARVDE